MRVRKREKGERKKKEAIMCKRIERRNQGAHRSESRVKALMRVARKSHDCLGTELLRIADS